MAVTSTPLCGDYTEKLYLFSGQFSITLKDSQSTSAVDTGLRGMEWDGTNTPWAGLVAHKLYLQSGLFSATLKTSIDVTALTGIPSGVSFDQTNTPWSALDGAKTGFLILQSGQFSATVKTSRDMSGTTGSMGDVSATGNLDTVWMDNDTPTIAYLQSGQFSATVKASRTVVSGAWGISWDGVNTPYARRGATDKMHLQSGQFSATEKTSLDIGTVDVNPRGVSSDDADGRLGAGAFTPTAVIF